MNEPPRLNGGRQRINDGSPMNQVSPALVEALEKLGRQYGTLWVARIANQLVNEREME